MLSRGSGFFQAMLLGLLLIFMFSLSRETGEMASSGEAATIFWLASAFCLTLVFNRLYEFEEYNGVRTGLLLSPLPVQGIWLGKMIAGLAGCALSQLLFFPALIIFLGRSFDAPVIPSLTGLVLADLGMCALGALLGASARGNSTGEALFSLLFFPLLVPLLLAGISLNSLETGAGNSDFMPWLMILGAFDAIYLATALLCFSLLYQEGR